MSLRTRLILSYILIIVLCLSIVAAALLVLLQEYRDKQAMARLGDMAKPVYVQVRSLARGQASIDRIWAVLQEQAEETGTCIFLLDDQGDVLRQVLPGGTSWEPLTELPSSKLPSNVARPYRGTYDTSGGQSFIFAAYPLVGLFRVSPPTAPKTLVLAMPRRDALALWANFTGSFLWAGLIALIVSIVIAIFLARSVYLPIRRITDAAEEIAQGHYDQEIPVAGPKEIKGLALTFNQMAKQVKHSQQMLRDFLADASHELRSPLTSISGFAQAILDGTARNRKSQLKAASVIEDESKRVIRLVDDLLELSRVESGQVQMEQGVVDVKELLLHCQEIFAVRAAEKDIRLETDIKPMTSVIGDIDRLEQVFSNLLDNALKHTPTGGRVNIVARQPAADFVEIIVADTGPGIPLEQLPYVFERFYRADASTAKAGTGLGLAISREIVRNHGGDIKVTSASGESTVFTVKLPVDLYGSTL